MSRRMTSRLLIALVVATTLAWFAIPISDVESELKPFTGIGSTYVTALAPSIELGQRQPLITKNRNEAAQPLAYWFEGTSKRLVVVVPGLGGNSIDAMNLWFARPFLKATDSVWVLPSPTHHSFAQAFMESFEYSASVNSLCQNVDELLGRIGEMAFEEVVLAGYSLGARHVISMAACDSLMRHRANLNFSILALNPPMSLTYAANVLSSANNYARSNFFKTAALGLYFTIAKGIPSGDITLDEFLAVSYARKLQQKARKYIPPIQEYNAELQGLVATVFNRKLVVTYSAFTPETQQVNLNVFETIASGDGAWKKADRLKKSEIELAIKMTDGRFLLFHSRDDFLIREEMLTEIDAQYSKFVVISKTGGHVGVIFQEDYLNEIDSSGVFRP